MAENGAIYGILGHHISYSMSPTIYTELFRSHQINAVYKRFDLAHARLDAFVEAAKLLPISGFNVTIPYKETIACHLTTLNSIAETTGSVNLVVNKGKRLRGYNTDYAGIGASLRIKLHFNARNKTAVVFGSGGSARTVVYYLCRNRAANVCIYFRSRGRADKFLSWVKNLPGKTTISFRPMASSKRLAEMTDLCVNCTPLPLEEICGKKVMRLFKNIFELRYYGVRSSHANHVDGSFMLAVQAAENFRILTGRKVTAESILRMIEKTKR